MRIESPHLPAPVPATREEIAALIPRLVGADDPFAIVSTGDPLTYAQVLWTGSGFVFEFQVGSLDQHFRTVRDDLDVPETIAALNAYAPGRPVAALGLEFRRVEVRSLAQRTGRLFGRMLRPFHRLYTAIR
jgi:hypothetical protein